VSGGVLGPGGALARALPGYEDRPEQRQMAAAVAAALEDRRPLLCEAGTGTGKTLAYLIPAAESGLRVVISTGTRALQEQLLHHDIPLAEAALGRPIKVAALKGVSNYLCRRRAAAIELGAAQRRLPLAPAREEAARADAGARDEALAPELAREAELEAIRAWMLTTETGDRAELGALGEGSPWWHELTATPDTRLGPRCPRFEGCFVTRARRAADRADLIVVNHHLYFADLSLRGASPGARVLPDHDAVIFDEAHLLEDVMTEHFGFGVSTVRLALIRRDLIAAGQLAVGLERAAADFFAAVRRQLEPLLGDGGRATLPDGFFARPDLQVAWFDLDSALEAAELGCRLEAERAEPAPASPGQLAAEEWASLARRTGAVRQALGDLAEPEPGEGRRSVRWGEVRGGQVLLRAAPIDVSPILRERVLSQVPRAVLTSATLTAAGRFTYARERLGLPADLCDELRVDSPFDYARQAMLYVPRDLPAPASPGFTAAACARIAALLELTGGRAFVLHTSHRALREAAALLPQLTRYPLLVQGEAPPAVLLDRFRATEGAVLLATGTFWAGVDVPGPSLSLVIMDKLPFASPGDPLVAARGDALAAAGRDPFRDLSLPQAALTFRQGFGRLIRRRDDRGIAAVLDPRLVGRAYGRELLASLPAGLPRTSVLEQVRRWWQGQAARPAPALEAGL